MEYINIGYITSTHGLKGELKLKSSFTYIDRVLQPEFSLYIGDNKEQVTLIKHRFHKGMYLLTFKGYEDINLVENFRNKKVYIIKEDLNLKNDEFLFEDYIGLKAYYSDKNIGTITDIIDCGNNNYVFSINDSEILIPLNKDFIEKVILNDRVLFKDVEGLINEN
ncbi:MAG: 16S rRNA processing protein RimM [Bacilli bacterium]|nr:16S rRNA processing protein RimM [Bacilli bacterium]